MDMYDIELRDVFVEPAGEAMRVLEALAEAPREERGWDLMVDRGPSCLDRQPPSPVCVGCKQACVYTPLPQGCAHFQHSATRPTVAGGDSRDHVENTHHDALCTCFRTRPGGEGMTLATA